MSGEWPLTRFYTKEDGHCPLSNFSAHGFYEDGTWWQTAEHYYQAMKSTHPGVRAEVALATSPGQAKRFGRTLTLRDDWEEIKIPVMRRALDRKFQPSPGSECGLYLLRTGDALLVEGNDWGDQFWGVDGTGQNWLGHLLMARRAELRSMTTNEEKT